MKSLMILHHNLNNRKVKIDSAENENRGGGESKGLDMPSVYSLELITMLMNREIKTDMLF